MVAIALIQILPYLDLGSNIGPFTLASRARGHQVISVDPDPENHAILYNSLGR